MSEVTLQALSLDGVLSFGDGYRTRQSELASDGFQIIRVSDVRGGSLTLSGADCVDRAFAKQVGKKTAQAGDVVLTTKGTVGRVAIVPSPAPEAVYSPQLCWFRFIDNAVLNAAYFRMWLESPEFRSQAAHMQANTDMAPYISLSDLRNTRITIPPLHEQQAIAEVLGALDDKIAANTALATTADALMNQTFASARRERMSPLSKLADFVNGKAFTKGASGTGRPVIRIAELNGGLSKSTVYSDIAVAEPHVARAGDILFAWSGSLTLHRWFREEGIVNQHIFKVLPHEEFPHWLLYEAIRETLPHFKSIAADKATTMGHIQRRHLDTVVNIPASDSMPGLTAVMEPLWLLALAAERESLTLAATRDAVLPKLMSGALRVRDAEKLISEAGV